MKTLILIIFLPSCAAINGDFNPIYDEGFIAYKFYDDISELREVCKDINIDIDNAVGCFICSGSICQIHSIKERCTWDHEIEHILYGDFHGNQSVTCKTRKD